MAKSLKIQLHTMILSTNIFWFLINNIVYWSKNYLYVTEFNSFSCQLVSNSIPNLTFFSLEILPKCQNFEQNWPNCCQIWKDKPPNFPFNPIQNVETLKWVWPNIIWSDFFPRKMSLFAYSWIRQRCRLDHFWTCNQNSHRTITFSQCI